MGTVLLRCANGDEEAGVTLQLLCDFAGREQPQE
jgi:hypothetical protein